MKIKKISEKVTYFEKSINYVFEVNGKKVRVIHYNKQDNEFEIYENDESINEDDLRALTDEEHEALGENLSENLELKIGEVSEIE